MARVDLAGPAIEIDRSWDFNGTWAQPVNPLTGIHLLSVGTRWDCVGLAIE